MRVGFILVVGAFVVAACGSSEVQSNCAPGQSVACTGDGMCVGFKVCKADGRGFDPCTCGSPTDASTDTGSDTGSDSASPGEGGMDAAPDGASDSGPSKTPWGAQIGGAAGTVAAIAVDPNKSLVFAGGYTGPNMYLELFDAGGSSKWKKLVNANTNANSVHSVFAAAFDNAGDVVAGGWNPSGMIDFGGGTISKGSFIVSYDSTGKYLWQQGHAGSRILCMARKSNGNVIVGGQLDGADNYGGGALNGGQDVLLVELTPAGGYVHAIAVGSQGNQLGWRCTVDKNDNVLLGGLFENTVDFGGGALQGPSPGNSSFNIFIAKLDSSFAHVASKEFKVSATNTYLFDLATDANANVYAVGMFDTTIDFGGGTLTSVGDRDMFLAKLDPSLGHVWSKRWGDPFYQTGTGAAVLANGNVAVTGNYSGNLNFGCGPLPSLSMGITGAFLTVLDPSGGCVSTQIINGTNVGFAGIAAFQAPDVIIGGGFYSSISLPSGGLSTGNQQDGFVARLKP